LYIIIGLHRSHDDHVYTVSRSHDSMLYK
jgi:hypothetical protein